MSMCGESLSRTPKLLHAKEGGGDQEGDRGSRDMARLESAEDARTVVSQVVAGEAHTLALTAAGSVYSWGRGLFGRLGVGIFQDELIPTYVGIGMNSDDDDSSVSSHSGSLSGKEDSRMFFARDKDGIHRARVVQVAAGAYHSLALSVDGLVWSWGYNACQLGREKAASQPSPVNFTFKTPAEEVRQGGALWVKSSKEVEPKQPKIMLVEAGGMISCAIDLDGSLWLWGAVPNPTEYFNRNKRSAFTLANVEKPEKVRALMGLRVYRVACGNEHIVALVEGRNDTASDLYSWGSNSFGQLGLGDVENRPYPEVVPAFAASAVGTVVDLACGAFHSAILTVKDDRPADLVLEPTSPKGRRVRPGGDIMQESPSPRGGFRKARQPAEQLLESMRSYPSKVRSRQDQASFSDTSSSTRSTAWSSSRHSSNRNLGAVPSKSKESFSIEGRVSTCWTFGQGENGQLGQGSASNHAYPLPVEHLPSRERLRTVVCGLFHTGVVTETGDVWVWGMEGGLGLCPGIGPPGARNGDALSPVRVFGESSANCHPVTGSKGIACGAAHTVTLSNGRRDIWAWGRGQSGVLGLGHNSDSWFPCPVVWPPVDLAPWTSGKGPGQLDSMYPMGFDMRKSSKGPSRTGSGSKERLDAIKHFKGIGTETQTEETDHKLTAALEEVSALRKELAGVRRYAAGLHAAIYGEVEVFTQQQFGDGDGSSDCGSSDQGRGNRGAQQKKAMQEWERRIESASDADMVRLELFYKTMQTRLKDILFNRKMDDWCRRCMSALSSSSPPEPPPMPEPYSPGSTPSADGPGSFSMRMAGILSDKAELLPPRLLQPHSQNVDF